MKGWNTLLGMTDSENRRRIFGTPKARASRGRHGSWTYRGIEMTSRKHAGWNSGREWMSGPINGIRLTAKFKDVLMTNIDKVLDLDAQTRADIEDSKTDS